MRRVGNGTGEYKYVEWSIEKNARRLLILTFLAILSLYLLYYMQPSRYTFTCFSLGKEGSSNQFDNRSYPIDAIHIAMVVCGDRMGQAMVLLKSATLLARAPILAHIFADDNIRPLMRDQLDRWPDEVRKKFSYSLYAIQYPEGQDFDQWKNLFQTCASQRLFFPEILKNLDSVLYFDSDTVVIGPLDELWNMFKKFNSSQIAAVANETEEAVGNWYRDPATSRLGQLYVQPYGVNSGVMLMNLTRIREVGWTNSFLLYYKRYKNKLELGDQDLINIYFSFSPEQLYIVPCNWNYRSDHCRYTENNCKSASENGVAVAHGNRWDFHDNDQPMFRAVYDAYKMHKFNESLEKDLLPRIQKFIKESPFSHCKNSSQIFTKQLERLLQKSAEEKSELTTSANNSSR